MINLDIEYNQPYIDEKKLTELIEYLCGIFELKEPEINIRIVDNKTIQQVNAKFLKHDYVTDVISFDMSDDAQKCFDIIVNAQLAEEKAAEYAHKPLAELGLYIIHGMLHNLGYDDSDSQKAQDMHKKEDEILHALGYGLVYNSKRPGV